MGKFKIYVILNFPTLFSAEFPRSQDKRAGISKKSVFSTLYLYTYPATAHESKPDLITTNNVENKMADWQFEKILQMQEQIQDKMNTFQLEINEIKTRLDQLILEPHMNVPTISLTPPEDSNKQCIQISEGIIGTTEM